MKKLTILTAFVLLAFASLNAAVINIPADYPTIQEGIDASENGDTVLVAAGTYVENINYNGKNIVVGSLYLTTQDTSYISSTIIDGNQSTSVVTFNSSETSSAQLIGLTVQNGNADDGGGIYCGNSCTPTLDHLYVVNNTANQFGGGIYLDVGADATITYSLISNNQASGSNGNGGGIGGTGLFLNATIQNCTIVGNAAWESGSGIYIQNVNPSSTNVQIINTILRNEQLLASWLDYYEEISSQQDGSTEQNDANFTVSYSLVRGGWSGTGILDVDPEFVDEVNGDYHLTVSSPCIDAGDPNSEYDPDGTIADMGAYYYDQSTPPDDGNYSLSFDGEDDYAIIEDISENIVDSDASLIGWFKINDNEGLNPLFGFRNYPNDYCSLYAIMGENSMETQVYGNLQSFIDGPFNLNEWYHVALVFNGSDFKTYLNGVLEASIETPSSIFDCPDEDLLIGGMQIGNFTYLNGGIDDISLWSEALNDSLIQSYMTTPPAGNEEGLVGYWNFNAGDEDILYDHSGNQNHGTINGATWVENIYGCTDPLAENYNPDANWDDGSCTYPDNGDYSLEFDGVDDYVLVDYTSGQIGSEISILSWVDIHDDVARTIIFNGCCGTAATWYWGLSLREFNSGDGIQPTAFLQTDQSNVGSGHFPASGVGAIEPNSGWHHVAMTYSNNTLNLYLDGISVYAQTIYGDDIFESGDLTIAGWDNGGGNFIGSFNGLLDEVAVFNQGLSTAEVQDYMDSGLIGNENELVAYWNFNAGSDTLLYDQSGNQNHGTINGATWSTDVPQPTNYSVSFEYMDGYASSDASSETIFQGVTSFSVEVWYKNPGIVSGPNDGSSHHGAIVTNYRRLGGGDPYNNFDLGIESNTANYPGYVSFQGTWSDEQLDDDQWHHIAGVYDNDNGIAHLFVDGVLNDSYNISEDFLSSSNKLYINNQAPFAGEFHMDCDIAGVRITDGVRYESNFSPSFPLTSEDNSIIALDFSTGDGTNLNDLSGNGNNFSLYDAASWSDDVPVPGCTDSLAGNFNPEANWDDGSCTGYPDNGDYSLSFDEEGDYIGDFNNDMLRIDGNLTIEFDILIDNNGTGQEDEVIISFERNSGLSDDNTLYAISVSGDGYLRYHHEYSDGLNQLYYPNIFLRDDNWHDIIISRDDEINLVKFYEDNVLVDEWTYSHDADGGTDSEFKISYPYQYHFKGNLNQIKIYNNKYEAINNDNLIVDYHFNAGSGDILYDHSGNQNHGTIYGATWERSYSITINIPADYPTIQEGINNSIDGDTVLVSAGTYVENINYNGKNIAVIGEDRETTIIDGNQSGSVVAIENGEDSTAVLSGLTLTNGSVMEGGGIYIYYSSPIIRDCIITDNNGNSTGGGIFADADHNTGYPAPTIENCLIKNNSATDEAGGIKFHYSKGKIINSTIVNNSGGIIGTGGVMASEQPIEIINCIIYNNESNQINDSQSNDTPSNIIFSDIQGGWDGEGNIDADPLFTDPENEDYTLQATSPCIDAGDPNTEYDPDGTIADMGAYFYDQSLNPSNTHSLSFDGEDDYVNIGRPLSLDAGNAGSSALWFKITSSGDPAELFTNDTEPTNPDFSITVEPDGKLRVVGYYYLQNSEVISSESYDDGEWHHVVGIKMGYDGCIQLYVDNEFIGEDCTSPSDDFDHNDDYFIGAARVDGTSAFHGLIDEILIYNRVLTASEVSSLYNQSAIIDPNLVGYWELNEGEGDIAYDSSPNNNDGTVYGASWSTDVPFGEAQEPSELSWSLNVQSYLGDANDNDNYLGVADGATNEYDIGLDQVEPPLPPNNYIAVYFPHPEWEYMLGNNFAQDVRPEISLTDTMQVWAFDVESDMEGDITLTFDFTDIPDVPVILEDEQTQTHWAINGADTYTFTYSGDVHHFNIAIGDTTPPTVDLLYPTGLDIFQTDSTLTILWDAQDTYQLDSVFVFYSRDGGNTYMSIYDFGDVDEGDWVIPHWYYEDDLYLKLIAEDHAGNTAEDVSAYACIASGDSLSVDITAGWTLWGAPFSPYETSMVTNVADDLTDWVTYDYIDGGYTFDGILSLGAGYWLGTTSSGAVDIEGEIASNPQAMEISAGWNLVSNPLVVDVPKANLVFSNVDTTYNWEAAVASGWIEDFLYTSDGNGYVDAGTLEYWHGYWLGALEDLTVQIENLPPTESARLKETREGWIVQLIATGESGSYDATNIVGHAAEATEGYDIGLDAVEPPVPPFDAVRLVLEHPEWNHFLGDEFAIDIRPEISGDELSSWQLTGTSGEDIVLSWSFSNLPEDLNVGLFTSAGMIDMREVSELPMLTDEFTSFEIRASFATLGVDGELIVPSQFALHQNFPNPFNPITSLRYDLPEQAQVTLTVYDMLGRKVTQLVNTTQEAGFRSVQWNATDTFGKPVSAGVYLYQILAGEFVQTRKMVLLK